VKVYAAPGNPGIARVATCLPGPDPLQIAHELDADLTVIGPEAPLVTGMVDRFRAAGRNVIGPTAANAKLEGSKQYAKQFFSEHQIPSARFAICESVQQGYDALRSFSLPVVIKADGLAAGKGVIVAHTNAEARTAIEQLGPQLVIEEFLTGPEVSLIVLTDGKAVVPLEPCQDHKAVFDGDQGPNTGGMGAYCDSNILSPGDAGIILDTIIEPTIRATRFTGFLFAGLMMTHEGPRLLEYNVRLGDPETQVLMHRMTSDWADLLMRAATGTLAGATVTWQPGPSLCVVATAANYPGAPETGKVIHGIEDAEATGAKVFQAGTALYQGQLVTAGGRVLAVTAGGSNIAEAQASAYGAMNKISFDGMHYRRDIGSKAHLITN
jgi:phosphoribosylamine--glycine ligase